MRLDRLHRNTMILLTAVCITPVLCAGPPASTDAEIEAMHAQYRQEMRHRQTQQQYRQDQAEAGLRCRQLCDEWRASIDELAVAQGGKVVSVQDRLGDLDFDYTAEPALNIASSDVSLAMMQDADAGPAPAKGGGDEDLAEEATNPIASLVQLQFQNQINFENNSADGTGNVFTVQPVLPWKLGDLTMLTRLTLPLMVATPRFPEPVGREYGVGDLVALNAMVFNIEDGPWKGMIGPIGTMTIPTASSDFIGEGKWQAGPGLIYINLATPGLQWGIFGYQQWSFADDGGDDNRREVSKLYFQPILTKHFEGGWYLALQDILWTIDWNDNARFSLPTGFRLGKVTKIFNQPANIFVEPFYDISGNNKGNEWGVKLSMSLLFPQ